MYSFITPDVLLKYRAPATRALPSLSRVGSDALVPRYRSSKLSYAAKVWSRAVSAAVWADCAAVLLASDAAADVADACAWYLALNSPPATAPEVLVAQSLARIALAAAAAASDAAEATPVSNWPLVTASVDDVPAPSPVTLNPPMGKAPVMAWVPSRLSLRASAVST